MRVFFYWNYAIINCIFLEIKQGAAVLLNCYLWFLKFCK